MPGEALVRAAFEVADDKVASKVQASFKGTAGNSPGADWSAEQLALAGISDVFATLP